MRMNKCERIGIALISLVFLSSVGCSNIGTYTFGDDLTQDRPGMEATEEVDTGFCDTSEGTASGDCPEHDVALEELEMEDSVALADVIRARLAAEAAETAPVEADPTQTVPTTSSVPVAHENLALSGKECLAALDERGIEVAKPDMEAPNVGTPLLLTGTIEGVSIVPRWPQSSGKNAIMDCHLVLALVELARQAKSQGVEKIMFYSTYRPIARPPEKCKRGKAGKKCRRLKEQYEKVSKNPSQHSRALAIDIRWLVTEDGETIDVLEHYDRRSRTPPCSYEPKEPFARLLTDFACELAGKRIFNVMLTPNANKAHHNHFHFDLTPGATWYIVR